MLSRIVESIFDVYLGWVIKSEGEKKSRSLSKNRTKIELKILIRYIVLTIRIIFYTFIIVYLVGSYWVVISYILYAEA